MRWGWALSAADRVGLGWRGALATGILVHLEAIDVIEVLADDHFRSSRGALRSIRALGRDVPIICHGVSLGLASVTPVDTWRIERLARVLDAIEPEMWSEHLAFVRAGPYEIGHLAAPPRNLCTLEGAVRNITRIHGIVGQPPALENIATLVDPPDSSLAEPEWVSGIIQASPCKLLLDLHNLHANCVNFGHDPGDFLQRLPLERVSIVHLSGGAFIEHRSLQHGIAARKLLDDHLHDVPDAVFAMLAQLAERCAGPLTVIIERDGRYPEFSVLIKQLGQARLALAEGRRRRATKPSCHELAAV
jgi:uncharacterized protein (UPF0276 family)